MFEVDKNYSVMFEKLYDDGDRLVNLYQGDFGGFSSEVIDSIIKLQLRYGWEIANIYEVENNSNRMQDKIIRTFDYNELKLVNEKYKEEK